jgi:NADH-quinone oxidoreductase subunit C
MSQSQPPVKPPAAPAPPPKSSQPEWLDGSNEPRVKFLKEKFGDKVLQAKLYAGELNVWVESAALVEVARHLKGEGYTYLVDIMGIHQPKVAEKPFALSYILHHMGTNQRLRLKVELKDGEEAPSVTGVWKASNWLEREAWDMVGIRFSGHPNLERILLWEEFNGHPLRKDFPIEGIDTGAAIYPDVYPEGGGPVKKKEKPNA